MSLESWNARCPEIAFLLNPAFCGAVLVSAVHGYCEENSEGLPYPLLYTVLPIILHRPTREDLPKTLSAGFPKWAQEHGEIRISLARRAHQLADYTREGFLFALNSGAVTVADGARLHSAGLPPATLSGDVPELLSRSLFWGRWMARSGPVRTIFYQFGLRP